MNFLNEKNIMNTIILILIISLLSFMIFMFAQHGKNNILLEPEEIEKLRGVLNDTNTTKKEKRAAKRKLQPHLKDSDEKHSRQKKDKKTKKRKR